MRAAILLALLIATSAAADDKRAAAAHVEAADTHYKLGRFEDALAEYSRAYERYPAPPLLFNIAQCHRNLKNWERAVFFFEGYLRARPNAKNRALVEDLLAEARTALAAEAARKAEEEAAAKRRAEEAEKLRLEAEAKRLEEQRKLRLAAEAKRLEDERLAAARRRAEDERLRRERALYDRHPYRKWTYVGAGVGVATLIAGGVFGVNARSAQAAFDGRGCGDPAQPLRADDIARCRSDLDRVERDSLLSNILIGTGVGLVAASAVVFFVDPGNVERPRTVAITPTSVQVIVRW